GLPSESSTGLPSSSTGGACGLASWPRTPPTSRSTSPPVPSVAAKPWRKNTGSVINSAPSRTPSSAAFFARLPRPSIATPPRAPLAGPGVCFLPPGPERGEPRHERTVPQPIPLGERGGRQLGDLAADRARLRVDPLLEHREQRRMLLDARDLIRRLEVVLRRR